jgi:predicted ATPase
MIAAPNVDVALPAPLARMSAKPFVSRKSELARLCAWLNGDAPGPRMVVVSGEPGIGKTHLAAEFARRARDSGAIAVYGRCDEQPVSPFWPFSQVLSSWIAGGDVGDPREHDGADWKLLDAVARLLRGVASNRRLVIVLDDLHWADEPSLELLRHVVRSLDGLPVMVVVATRDVEARSSPAVAMLAQLRREIDVERIALEGLDLDATDALARALNPGGLPWPLIRQLHEQTAGNPFLLCECLRDVRERLSASRPCELRHVDPLSACAGAKDAVIGWLTPFSCEERALLDVASAAGVEFSIQALERMLDKPAERVLPAIDKLIAAQLVAEVPGAINRFYFRHPLLRAALSEQLSWSRRVQLAQVGSEPAPATLRRAV